jgi:hypothetical protein
LGTWPESNSSDLETRPESNSSDLETGRWPTSQVQTRPNLKIWTPAHGLFPRTLYYTRKLMLQNLLGANQSFCELHRTLENADKLNITLFINLKLEQWK